MIKMTSKRLKDKKVPNLRFPGFEGEWETKKLGEVVSFKAGYAFKSNYMLSQPSTYQILKMSNVYQNNLRLDRSPSYWFNIDEKLKDFLIKEGDILLTLTGTVGKRDFGYSVQINESNKFLLNQRLVLLREENEKSINDFIKQVITTDKFLYHFFNEAKGGTGNQANVGVDDIKKINLNFPKIKEQKKIASFLSLIDERIHTQNKIIEELEQLIKGLCQKLFHNRNNKDWSEQSIEDVLEERKEVNTDNYTVHSVSVSKGVINQIEYLGRSFAAKDTKNYNVVHYGDIVYTKSPTGEFPYGIIKQSFIKERVAVSPLYGVFRAKSFYMANILHFYFSNPINVQNYLQSIIQKGAKNTISITNQSFLKKRLYLPIDEKEIKKISSLLSAIESKKTVEMNIIERLKNQKEHFLQQMFI